MTTLEEMREQWRQACRENGGLTFKLASTRRELVKIDTTGNQPLTDAITAMIELIDLDVDYT